MKCNGAYCIDNLTGNLFVLLTSVFWQKQTSNYKLYVCLRHITICWIVLWLSRGTKSLLSYRWIWHRILLWILVSIIVLCCCCRRSRVKWLVISCIGCIYNGDVSANSVWCNNCSHSSSCLIFNAYHNNSNKDCDCG